MRRVVGVSLRSDSAILISTNTAALADFRKLDDARLIGEPLETNTFFPLLSIFAPAVAFFARDEASEGVWEMPYVLGEYRSSSLGLKTPMRVWSGGRSFSTF